MQYKQLVSCFITSLCLSGSSFANDIIPNELTEAFKNGTPTVSFRIRHENAKEGKLEDAKATTLRSTVGYETAEFSHSNIKVELIDVANLFGQRYNPAVNDLSKPAYSTIRDAKGAGLTEGNLSFKGIDKNVIKIGRQYIRLDNRRFVAKNDFRQFPQSFDAISIDNTMIESLNLFYGFLTHVNTTNSNSRSDGGRRTLHTHLINGRWDGYQYGSITGYVYLNKDRTIRTNSHSVVGLRVLGTEEQTNNFNYLVELARQQGKFGNPSKYTAYYAHGEIGKTIELFNGAIGVERLGGDGSTKNKAFIMPLGNQTNFNGLAQVFSSTPSRGLQDYYATVGAKHKDIAAALTYHYFLLENGPGSKRAGQELDLSLDFKLSEQVTFSTVYASYNSKNSVAPRTRRFWLMLTANII